ncbi:MAG: D-alanyl-D-alanine carboxypeptidase [Clostridiales bacterium]|nr:D-alanyl-D-alanine carboxypeptidase [Clostridiales bacterium]
MFFKKKLCILVSMILVLSHFNILNAEEKAPLPAEGQSSLTVDAKSAILIEPTSGKIILEQNSHDRLALASVTKIMTIFLIYEALDEGKINWGDVVTVSEHAASMGGSQIFLEPAEQQTVRDLTKSILIASANDSSVAMAEFIGGSEENFVNMMNAKAKALNMSNTNFMNACGLDADEHYSSAYDIALMTKELINCYPQVFEYSKTWQDSITHKTARGESEFGLTNTNKLVKRYQGATGLKTGSTSKALYCLSATAEREGMSLIAVVLAAPDPNVRFQEVMKMFDYGFATFAIACGEKPGAVVGKIPVLTGKIGEVDVIVKDQVNTIVSKGKSKTLASDIQILPGLNAPVEKGTKAGEIVYSFNDKEVGRSDLVIAEDVAMASNWEILRKSLENWFKGK